ncbi:MAG: hypothetical protein AAGN82_05735 [Myxococcota bacterium]
MGVRGHVLGVFVVASVCAAGQPAHADEFPVQEAQVTYSGLRGQAFVRDGIGPNERSHGLLFASRSLGTATVDGLTVHRDVTGALGWGTADFVGEIGGVIRGGYRFDVGPTHGPFGRGGVRGFLGGNDLWFHSHVEVPHAQLGYQWLDDRTFFEVAFDGGLSALGHFEAANDQERPLTLVPGWGAELVVHHRPIRLDVVWLRFQPPNFGPATGPLDRLDVNTCLTAWKLGLCNQFRFYRGDLASETGTSFPATRAFSASLTLGLSSATAKGDVIRRGDG